jgi:hypothetical protein
MYPLLPLLYAIGILVCVMVLASIDAYEGADMDPSGLPAYLFMGLFWPALLVVAVAVYGVPLMADLAIAAFSYPGRKLLERKRKVS